MDCINFKSQELEAGAWQDCLHVLKDQAQLFAQQLTLRHSSVGSAQRCAWGKNGKKIVQIMAELAWYMPKDDPMQSLCKEIENVRGRSQAKG